MEIYLWGGLIVFVWCMAKNYNTFTEINNYFDLNLGLVVMMSVMAGLLWPLTVVREVANVIAQRKQ